MMAQGVYITDSDWHDVYDRNMSIGQTEAVIIGSNVWIGDSAIICKGVTIGDNSIIGAGAVVVKNIPPDVIAAGNPAIVVKKLDWFVNPECLVAQFDEIDRNILKRNTIAGWLRSILFPKKGD
jgi:acetyltransferase-like isoleucine patch superfamily enzyme